MFKYMIGVSVVFGLIVALALVSYPGEEKDNFPDLAKKAGKTADKPKHVKVFDDQTKAKVFDDSAKGEKVFDDTVAGGEVFERVQGAEEKSDEPKDDTKQPETVAKNDDAKESTDEGGEPDEHKTVELPPIPAGSAPWFTGTFSDPIPTGTWYSPFHSHRHNPKKNLDYPHAGVDLHCKIGDPVYAVGGGVMRPFKDGERSGKTIYLDHGLNSRGKRIMTVYMHLNSVPESLKKEGTLITAGQQIATCGDSGNAKGDPQLHFELVVDGDNVDPCTELACPDYLIRGQQKLAMR